MKKFFLGFCVGTTILPTAGLAYFLWITRTGRYERV